MKFYLEKYVESLYPDHKIVVEDNFDSYRISINDGFNKNIDFVYYKGLEALYQFYYVDSGIMKIVLITIQFEQFIRRYKIYAHDIRNFKF